jgi:protein-S-isoprenylcysteine O-methyltransferase Ste14
LNIRTNWINLIYKVATGSKKVRTILTPIVGLSYFLFTTLFVIVSFLLDSWLHFPRFPQTPVNLFLSIPIMVIGLALILWCLFNFIKVKGTPVPFNPPPKLVTNGPYAYIRNPMLSGVFFLLFGIGFAWQSISLLAIFAPIFILMNVLEIKTIEEPELEMRLGMDYLEYKKKTPMFLPKVW